MTVKVTDALRSFTPPELAAALARRSDLIVGFPGTLADLGARACQPRSVALALAGVDRWTHQVAELLAMLPEGVSAAEVAGRAGAPATAADVERAYAVLRERLLLFVVKGATRLNPGVRQVIPRPFGLGRPVATLLHTRPDPEVSAIAHRLLGPDAARNGTVAREAISAALADPATVARVLSADTKALEVLKGRPAVLALPAGTWWDRVAQQGRLANGLEWLVGNGLVVISGWAQGEVPREVGLLLHGDRPLLRAEPHAPLVASTPVAQDDIDRHAADQVMATLQQLARLLGVLGSTPAEPLKTGGLGAREVGRIAKAASLDTARAAVLLELALAADLVPTATRAVAPTERADEWLAAPPAQRWVDLAARWWATELFPSLALRKDLTEKVLPALLHRSMPGERDRRRGVLRVLQVLGAERAPASGAAVAAAAVWHAPSSEVGGVTIDVVSGVLDEAAAVGVTGAGGLSSVGRLIVEGDLEAARTRAGELLRPPPAEVILQADLTVMVDARVEHDLLAELRLLADAESEGSAVVLRFSPGSVRRALDAGRSAADIVAFLERHAPRGVPQPLRYLVEDTERRWGRLRVGPAATYLRCDEPALLAEAVLHRGVASLNLRLLAPTVAITAAPVERLLTALRQAGFLPASEDHLGAVLVPPETRRRHEGTPGWPSPRSGPAPKGLDPLAVAERLLSGADGDRPSVTRPRRPTGSPALEAALDEIDRRFARPHPDDEYDDELEADEDNEIPEHHVALGAPPWPSPRDVYRDVLEVLDEAAQLGTTVEVVVIDERRRVVTGRVAARTDEVVVLLTEPLGQPDTLYLDEIVGITFLEANRR